MKKMKKMKKNEKTEKNEKNEKKNRVISWKPYYKNPYISKSTESYSTKSWV